MCALEGQLEAFNLTNRVNNLTRNANFGAGAYPTNPVADLRQITAVGDPQNASVRRAAQVLDASRPSTMQGRLSSSGRRSARPAPQIATRGFPEPVLFTCFRALFESHARSIDGSRASPGDNAVTFTK